MKSGNLVSHHIGVVPLRVERAAASVRVYPVGEKGMEWFAPGTSGTIIPNGGKGDTHIHHHYNIDARGTELGCRQPDWSRTPSFTPCGCDAIGAGQSRAITAGAHVREARYSLAVCPTDHAATAKEVLV